MFFVVGRVLGSGYIFFSGDIFVVIVLVFGLVGGFIGFFGGFEVGV